MTTPQHPTPQYAPPPPPAAARKKPRRWPWILGILAAFGLGTAIGSSGSGSTTATPTTVTAPATAGQQPATQAPATAAGPKTEFGDGTYKVGDDIATGTYKTSGPRTGSPLCYWARLKDDAGTNIIANNAGQGPARVTVKAGEYLQVTGCDFAKA